MTHKGNNAIPNAHFHKKWQRRIRTWFNQPSKQLRRRIARKKKAMKLTPRPTYPLRPAVRCPTVRYHTKVRLGRGFTLEEIKRAGLCPQFARTIGITVDHRRRNKSYESLSLNVSMLKEYLSRLILFPTKGRVGKKIVKGEATDSEQACAVQLSTKNIVIPKGTEVSFKARTISAEDKKFSPYTEVRKVRTDLLLMGKREKKLNAAMENADMMVKTVGKKKRGAD